MIFDYSANEDFVLDLHRLLLLVFSLLLSHVKGDKFAEEVSV